MTRERAQIVVIKRRPLNCTIARIKQIISLVFGYLYVVWIRRKKSVNSFNGAKSTEDEKNHKNVVQNKSRCRRKFHALIEARSGGVIYLCAENEAIFRTPLAFDSFLCHGKGLQQNVL